jgi:flagellin-like protein
MLCMKQKAVSPLIAVLLLIGITVGGGGLVYTAFTQVATTATIDDSLQIKELKLVTNNLGETVLSATVKNVGDTTVDSIILFLNADTDTTIADIQQFNATFSPSSIDPSQTTALSLIPVTNATSEYIQFDIGQPVQYVVKGETPSGSTPQASSSVTVSLS